LSNFVLLKKLKSHHPKVQYLWKGGSDFGGSRVVKGFILVVLLSETGRFYHYSYFGWA